MKMIILVLSTCFTGLMAGLFYSWSMSVIPGLARIGDDHYLQAFQAMNRAILNPALFIPLMGLIVLLPLLCFLYYQSPIPTQFWLILGATMLYLGGVMLVTIFGNVPMNNTLEVLQLDSMSNEQMKAFRLGFEQKWNNLNLIRTICSTAAFILLIMACLRNFDH